MFAFNGEIPVPEIYRVRIADPGKRIAKDPHWSYLVVMFADPDSREILGLQSLVDLEEGYANTDFADVKFVDLFTPPVLNADGTYQMVGDMEKGIDEPGPSTFSLKAFRRETHSATLEYFSKYKGMEAPETLTYEATRL
jgi:hypothetical protein